MMSGRGQLSKLCPGFTLRPPRVLITFMSSDTVLTSNGVSPWIDYLEEAKVNGEWKIINVLWELKPRSEIQSQIQFKALVITHVSVIDVRDGHTRPDMTVVISGNRIVEMGEAGRTYLPKDAQVIDESGRYLIPGLWDMHVHLGNATEAALPLLVASGITGVRDMGSPSFETLRRWRVEVLAGLRVGPRIV